MPILRIGDIDLYYIEAGAGPPLVLLHGLGSCADDWELQIPKFAERYRVIAPELRGFARTGAGNGPTSIARLADDIWQFVQKLGLRQIALVGYSMGGAVAQQLALDHPELVTRMVISNSMPTFRPRTLRERFEIAYRYVVMILLGPKRLAVIAALRMYPAPHQAELRNKVIERSHYNSRRGYLRALHALTRWSAMERLGELQMPVLVIASEHDYFPREDSVRFAHALPQGRFRYFKKMHHGLPMEAPAAYNAAVLKFLSAKT